MSENIFEVTAKSEEKKAEVKQRREAENMSLRALLKDSDGRKYLLRQLKRAFPLGGGSLCAGREGTFYNLGKFESYIEILLDLQQAVEVENQEERKYISEILTAWFFNEEVNHKSYTH